MLIYSAHMTPDVESKADRMESMMCTSKDELVNLYSDLSNNLIQRQVDEDVQWSNTEGERLRK